MCIFFISYQFTETDIIVDAMFVYLEIRIMVLSVQYVCPHPIVQLTHK